MSLLTYVTLYTSIVALSYVLILHVGAESGSRNEPSVIRIRLKKIIAISIANLIIAPIVLIYWLKLIPDLNSFFLIMGFKNIFKVKSLIEVQKTLSLFMILFIGPLSQTITDFRLEEHYSSYIEIVRDLLFAPMTEELFFTSLALGSFLSYELSKQAVPVYSPTVFSGDNSIDPYLKLTPLLFGFAHLHHAIEMFKSSVPILQIVIICGFQCLYTTLFGYLTNLIFVNTGSIWCCFIAHAFCNFMGLPSLNIEGSLSRKISYWFLLVFGIVGFGVYFDKLTYDHAK